MAAMDPKLAKSLKIEDEANMINFDKVCARQSSQASLQAIAQLLLEDDSGGNALLT